MSSTGSIFYCYFGIFHGTFWLCAENKSLNWVMDMVFCVWINVLLTVLNVLIIVAVVITPLAVFICLIIAVFGQFNCEIAYEHQQR